MRFRAMFDRTTISAQPSRHRGWQGALLLAGAWTAFALLQTLVSFALSRDGADEWQATLRVNLAAALYWAAVSVPIAAYHRRLRDSVRGLPALVLAHAPLFMVVFVAAVVVIRAAWRWLAHEAMLVSFPAALTYYADFEIVSYVAVVAVTEALFTRRALRERQRVAARLEWLLARARLDFLEAQLQPHFLFNALGAVSELAYEAPAAAARVLRALISIIRGALSAKANEVTLGDELVAIEPYLDIQRIRFADWLRIDYDVDDDAVDCLVPRFVLQPLVENAIRHGLTGRLAPGSIVISAAVVSDDLVVRVADNGVGLHASRGASGYGIGLTNVRERLDVLYGDASDRLRLRSENGSGTVAELRIRRRSRDELQSPAHEEADARSPESAIDALARESESASDDHVVSSPSRDWRRQAVATAAIWFLCGLLWSQLSFAYLAVRNRLGESSWLSVARNDMAWALVWAALTPLVFAGARRLPIRRPWLAPRIVAYLAAGVLIAFVHVTLLQRIVNPRGPMWSPVYQGTLLVDLVIAGVLVAIGHRRQLAAWLRDREEASAALGAEVREARTRAARLQSISPLLLQALEHIAAVARSEPARTEQLLARLADYLRVAIECSDERGVTPEREHALSYCLAQLEERGGFVLQPNGSA